MMSTEAIARAIITTPADREIRVERTFNAPRARVWRAFTDPEQVRQWWGRGNPLEIERMDVEPGGHWRYVEHGPEGDHGFEGRYGEVVPEERIVMTFEWDGMPAHVSLETIEFEDLGDGRTKVVNTSVFFTTADRDGMLQSGMEAGLEQSYAALDRLLARQG
ncbi:MAG TPA: SRPBCC family protein [Gemmatimonadaceae bacterium]|nr:SRPBCC family protein [Gemmatimonadaceae bacterium]